MRERDVEAAVCMFAAGVGVGTLKLNGSGARGKSDRLFFKDGKAIFIEMKATGEKPTELQLRNIRKLREKGMFADWTDSPKQASQWILDHLIR